MSLTFKRSLSRSSIYVIAIPITTSRSYIYCNHTRSVLDSTQLQTVPLINRLETKVVGFAARTWNNLNTSKYKINQKIVEYVKKLLDTIPYEENCLKLFPSKSVMIREINKQEVPLSSSLLLSLLIQSEVEKHRIPANQLKPIPLYHPAFQSPATIIDQLYFFRNHARSLHLKNAIYCAVGIPITLPFALVPVVPNVPGLYLTYRLYCNIKALLGVKHLDYLLQTRNTDVAPAEPHDSDKVDLQVLVQDTNHLTFEINLMMDSIYKLSNTAEELECDHANDDERLLITKEIITVLCEKLELPDLRDDLRKALKHEAKRLDRERKLGDAVE
jgi:hypothetical protein